MNSMGWTAYGTIIRKTSHWLPRNNITNYLSTYHYLKYRNNVLIKLFYSSLNQLMENVWIKWINVELWLELFYCAVFVVNNLKNVRLDTALQSVISESTRIWWARKPSISVSVNHSFRDSNISKLLCIHFLPPRLQLKLQQTYRLDQKLSWRSNTPLSGV